MFGMNKQREEHMNEGEGHHDDRHSEHMPSIHIHSHAKGHTVHIMHPSGEHEKHEHEHGDVEGIMGHIHEHLGTGAEMSPESGEATHEEDPHDLYA